MSAKNRSSVGRLVERTTCLVILAKVIGTKAAAMAVGFSEKLNEVQCIYDQEMVKHT